MRALVERALAHVPAGRVTTYGDIARALGDVKAARAVGEILASNADPARVPCHRVVMADGSMGGYAFGGPGAKAKRLAQEGVPISEGAVRDLEAVAVRALDLPRIFGDFAKVQAAMAGRVSTKSRSAPPKVAIGVDASYAKGDGLAHAAAVAVDLNTGEEFASSTVPFLPPVPYVPGYLAFRELPGVIAAVKALPAEARRRAVVLTDGQGILHPRRCGIASMAGVELGLPALGTAKGRLVGTVAAKARRIGRFEGRAVRLDGETRGFELRPVGEGPAVYVSPGTGMTVLEAAQVAAALTQPGEKSPLPVALADALSRRARAQGA
jgi:deoxyribonuclease V